MKMRWFLIGVALLSQGTAFAQAARPNNAPVLPRLTVAQIVEKNAAARGGSAAWAAVRTMALSGTLDAGRVRKDGGAVVTSATQAKARERVLADQILSGKAPQQTVRVIELPFTLDLGRPNRSRLEIPVQGATAVQVFDGSSGWKVRPFLGRHEVEPFSAEELASAQDQQELDGPLLNYAAHGIRAALDGSESVEGRAAYRLKLTLKDGSGRRVWVDGQSFLEVKYESAPRRFDGRMRPVYTFYRDYRPEEGLMVAHRLETAVDGVRLTEKITIQKVVFNRAMDNSRFAKPL